MSTSTSTSSKGSTTPAASAKSPAEAQKHSTPATSDMSDADEDMDSVSEMDYPGGIFNETDDEDDGYNHPVINDTIRAITAFLKTDVRKYPGVDLKIKPLRAVPYGYTDSEQFDIWHTGIEVLLQFYQVWPVVSYEVVRLPAKGKTCHHIREAYPDLPKWRVHEGRMLSVATALIFANLDDEVRANRSVRRVISNIVGREPEMLMYTLIDEFGPNMDDDESSVKPVFE
ncbi:unnamed protein product [Penicillium manginii]